MEGSQGVPYSRKALENLAVALRVDSAAIWFNPTTSRVDLKETRRDEDLDELMEAEE
jgi:hypothetical protein